MMVCILFLDYCFYDKGSLCSFSLVNLITSSLLVSGSARVLELKLLVVNKMYKNPVTVRAMQPVSILILKGSNWTEYGGEERNWLHLCSMEKAK